MDDPEQRWEQIAAEIAQAPSPDALEQVRINLLGRRGSLTQAMRVLGELGPDERRRVGAQLNELKDRAAAEIEARAAVLHRAALAERLAGERADVTLPVLTGPPGGADAGRIHPISQTIDEIVAIFGEMGFAVAEGPHIETDFHNFTALNIPPEHPARQEHDTFYLPPGRTAAGSCCAPRPRRCRSARCRLSSRR